MKRTCIFTLAMLAFFGFANAQEKPFEKTNEFRVGFKTGRTFFTNPMELGGQSSNVFFGQAGVDYGICRNENIYYGAGIGAEFIDLLDAELSFPAHLDLRYYFMSDRHDGAFLNVQVGYVLCSQQSFPVTISELGEAPVGQIVRKSSGPFGEIAVGYRTNRFDFYVSYDYRVTHYLKTYYFHNPYYNMEDITFFKPMHTFMAGVSYKAL